MSDILKDAFVILHLKCVSNIHNHIQNRSICVSFTIKLPRERVSFQSMNLMVDSGNELHVHHMLAQHTISWKQQ